MNEQLYELIEQLKNEHSLSVKDYEYILENRCTESAQLLRDCAVRVRKDIYGNTVFIRGLIEISNICKNNCLYCGIRNGNKACSRYRLMPEEILECVDEGYALGFRTFVMQGGEDAFFGDDILCSIIDKIKSKYPDCAVTLSLGERSYESYKRLYDAGADRYLLRHETADEEHYKKLHPPNMSLKNRMECLYILKEIGYQVGCGFMVASPYQTNASLAKDLKFIESFKPDMCGIGPFIPHNDTPLKDSPPGTLDLTCYLLSIIRLIYPPVLLPSTTALSTIHPKGREQGIMAGANVIMPNLSPLAVRKKYRLYNDKICTGEESAQNIEILKEKMRSIGYEIVTGRGDINKEKKQQRKKEV